MTRSSDGAPPGSGRWSLLDGLTLRSRLVAIIALLLIAGLGIATAATTGIVSNYLIGQVDDQLRRVVTTGTDSQQAAGTLSVGPTEYYTSVVDPSGVEISRFAYGPTIAEYGRPRLPAAPQRTTKPFTVGSISGTAHSEWRVIAAPGHTTLTGEPVTVYIARPLGEIQKTVRVLALTLALSAAAIVIVGSLAARAMVRRTLRPLRQMESTAADIAAGDLSRRVPPAAPTTEVGSLSTSLNAMLGQIERAFADREASETRMRQFVSDASHELRTPLATIRGYGELYRMGALDTSEKVDDTMGRIEDAASRMGTLVADLLALARLDEGRPLRHDPIDLVTLARDSAQDLHALDPTRIVTVCGLDGNDPPARLQIIGDEERLRQVFVNLVGNVARHTPAGTAAEIALGPDDGVAVVEVRDHGPGIDAHHADRIFERFYRADSSRNRSSGGSGLGMAIVAAIVGAHGGSAAVRPTPGGGLTVVVHLAEHEYDGASAAREGDPT